MSTPPPTGSYQRASPMPRSTLAVGQPPGLLAVTFFASFALLGGRCVIALALVLDGGTPTGPSVALRTHGHVAHLICSRRISHQHAAKAAFARYLSRRGAHRVSSGIPERRTEVNVESVTGRAIVLRDREEVVIYVFYEGAADVRDRSHPSAGPDGLRQMVGMVELDVLRIHQHGEWPAELRGNCDGANTAAHHLAVDAEVRDLVSNRRIRVCPYTFVLDVIRTAVGRDGRDACEEGHCEVQAALHGFVLSAVSGGYLPSLSRAFLSTGPRGLPGAADQTARRALDACSRGGGNAPSPTARRLLDARWVVSSPEVVAVPIVAVACGIVVLAVKDGIAQGCVGLDGVECSTQLEVYPGAETPGDRVGLDEITVRGDFSHDAVSLVVRDGVGTNDVGIAVTS